MVFALLQDPIVDGDVANQKAADQFKQATNEYLAFSEYLTQLHAGTKAKVTRVEPMGFDDAIAEATLKRHGCDVAELCLKRYGLDVSELCPTLTDREQRLSTDGALLEPQNKGVVNVSQSYLVWPPSCGSVPGGDADLYRPRAMMVSIPCMKF